MNLTPEEIRVLGCLVEKQSTTPDGYPLSTNGLLAACNQRTSREPVVDYTESTVTETLISLRERGLARTARGEGSRAYKHSHLLDSALGLDAAELAALSVLMLRGPQTSGEIRTRSERQHRFSSLDAVEGSLGRLAEREPPLVTLSPRRSRQREDRWSHTLGSHSATRVDLTTLAGGSEQLPVEIAALRRVVNGLQALLDDLEARF
jgi:hypothetical protein